MEQMNVSWIIVWYNFQIPGCPVILNQSLMLLVLAWVDMDYIS